MNPAITENFSEKRKRGRPPAFEGEVRKLVEFFDNGHCLSSRGFNNKGYLLEAMSAIKQSGREEQFTWLVDGAAMRTGKALPGSWKKTILSELGRIKNDDVLLAVAKKLCEEKPSTTAAVRYVRACRLGRYAPGDARSLTVQLLGFLERYEGEHPKVSIDQIVSALYSAIEAIESVSARTP